MESEKGVKKGGREGEGARGGEKASKSPLFEGWKAQDGAHGGSSGM